jgi:cytosine/adenosine deaminase-related metal-dependent hydrolase
MSRTTLTATWVLPVDGPPIRDGRVCVADGRVVWVGPAGDPGAPEAEVRDLGPGVLLPGLVNAHCHLELSPLDGQAPFARGFVPWVEAVVAARGRRAEDAERSRAEAIRSLEERGTVAVGDVSNALEHLDQLAASRLRAVVFLELLAWDPARAEATITWAEERLAEARRVPTPAVEVRLAAHAPHSVSPELLRRLVERGGVGAIHLAESPEESRFLARGDGPWADFLERRGLGHVGFRPPGTSPVEYVDGLGLLHPALVVVHAVHVGEEDRVRLARRGVSVAVCPRSNRNIGVGTADVPALVAAGVRLCLGTDSLASVETLDLLDDAVCLTRQFPALDPAAVVRMATAGGAEALGLNDLGTITPGKRAALAFAGAASPPADPHAHLLSGRARLSRVDVP